MGRDFSVWLKFETKQIPITIFEALFSSTFFHPVAIGGLDGLTRWFLAGYELGEFVTHFFRPNIQPELIEIASPREDVAYPYLASLAQKITDLKFKRELSPFEIQDTALGATYLDQSLDASVLAKIEDWINRFPRGCINIYGTLELSASNLDNAKPVSLYRPLSTSEWIQVLFLEIWVRKAPVVVDPVGTVTVTLYTQSLVWLEEGRALNNRVGVKEADSNLSNLVTLAKNIIEANRPQFLATNVNMEGSPFHREWPRISAALYEDLQPFES